MEDGVLSRGNQGSENDSGTLFAYSAFWRLLVTEWFSRIARIKCSVLAQVHIETFSVPHRYHFVSASNVEDMSSRISRIRPFIVIYKAKQPTRMLCSPSVCIRRDSIAYHWEAKT